MQKKFIGNIPNTVCKNCGKEIYIPSYQRKYNVYCCSRECKDELMYKNGLFRLKPYCKEHNITEKQFIENLGYLHNKEMKTIKEIASQYGIARITISRYFEKYNIHTRNISEDNARRYSKMTDEQKKEQVRKANEGIRELFKNKEWKENQMRKVLEIQNFCSSKPELLFGKLLNENGYYPISQYSEGLCGFILDYAFPDIKLGIEIDGEYWHSLEKTKKRDKRKNYLLRNKMGWELIRIPAKDFELHSEHYIWEVIQTIETLKIA